MSLHQHHKLGLLNLTEAAEQVGLTYQQLWHAVHTHEALPAPTTHFGHRRYYDGEQLANLKTKVAKLKKAGVI